MCHAYLSTSSSHTCYDTSLIVAGSSLLSFPHRYSSPDISLQIVHVSQESVNGLIFCRIHVLLFLFTPDLLCILKLQKNSLSRSLQISPDLLGWSMLFLSRWIRLKSPLISSCVNVKVKNYLIICSNFYQSSYIWLSLARYSLLASVVYLWTTSILLTIGPLTAIFSPNWFCWTISLLHFRLVFSPDLV